LGMRSDGRYCDNSKLAVREGRNRYRSSILRKAVRGTGWGVWGIRRELQGIDFINGQRGEGKPPKGEKYASKSQQEKEVEITTKREEKKERISCLESRKNAREKKRGAGYTHST